MKSFTLFAMAAGFMSKESRDRLLDSLFSDAREIEPEIVEGVIEEVHTEGIAEDVYVVYPENVDEVDNLVEEPVITTTPNPVITTVEGVVEEVVTTPEPESEPEFTTQTVITTTTQATPNPDNLSARPNGKRLDLDEAACEACVEEACGNSRRLSASVSTGEKKCEEGKCPEECAAVCDPVQSVCKSAVKATAESASFLNLSEDPFFGILFIVGAVVGLLCCVFAACAVYHKIQVKKQEKASERKTKGERRRNQPRRAIE